MYSSELLDFPCYQMSLHGLILFRSTYRDTSVWPDTLYACIRTYFAHTIAKISEFRGLTGQPLFTSHGAYRYIPGVRNDSGEQTESRLRGQRGCDMYRDRLFPTVVPTQESVSISSNESCKTEIFAGYIHNQKNAIMKGFKIEYKYLNLLGFYTKYIMSIYVLKILRTYIYFTFGKLYNYSNINITKVLETIHNCNYTNSSFNILIVSSIQSEYC